MNDENRLKQYRLWLGLTQGELAKEAGVSIGTISNAENGHEVNIKTAKMISGALGIPLPYIATNLLKTITVMPDAIRINREARGMSLNQLSKEADIPYMSLWGLEHGRFASTHVETVVKIADALGVEPGSISLEFDLATRVIPKEIRA